MISDNRTSKKDLVRQFLFHVPCQTLFNLGVGQVRQRFAVYWETAIWKEKWSKMVEGNGSKGRNSNTKADE